MQLKRRNKSSSPFRILKSCLCFRLIKMYDSVQPHPLQKVGYVMVPKPPHTLYLTDIQFGGFAWQFKFFMFYKEKIKTS